MMITMVEVSRIGNLELWTVTIPYLPMLEEKIEIKKDLKKQTKKIKKKESNWKIKNSSKKTSKHNQNQTQQQTQRTTQQGTSPKPRICFFVFLKLFFDFFPRLFANFGFSGFLQTRPGNRVSGPPSREPAQNPGFDFFVFFWIIFYFFKCFSELFLPFWDFQDFSKPDPATDSADHPGGGTSPKPRIWLFFVFFGLLFDYFFYFSIWVFFLLILWLDFFFDFLFLITSLISAFWEEFPLINLEERLVVVGHRWQSKNTDVSKCPTV